MTYYLSFLAFSQLERDQNSTRELRAAEATFDDKRKGFL